jgi:hypothetical protein
VIWKLDSTPSPSNAFKVLLKLSEPEFEFSSNKEKISKIYLNILQIYLTNKHCEYLKTIEQIITRKLLGDPQFLTKLLTGKKVDYCLFLPCTLPLLESLPSKEKQQILKSADSYLTLDSQPCQYKCYLAAGLLRVGHQRGIMTFLHYFERAAAKDDLAYEELAYYAGSLVLTAEELRWLSSHF